MKKQRLGAGLISVFLGLQPVRHCRVVPHSLKMGCMLLARSKIRADRGRRLGSQSQNILGIVHTIAPIPFSSACIHASRNRAHVDRSTGDSDRFTRAVQVLWVGQRAGLGHTCDLPLAARSPRSHARHRRGAKRRPSPPPDASWAPLPASRNGGMEYCWV